MNEKENILTRKPHLGKKAIKPENEWSGKEFGLNIGDRLTFNHKPLEMKRDRDGILIQK